MWRGIRVGLRIDLTPSAFVQVDYSGFGRGGKLRTAETASHTLNKLGDEGYSYTSSGQERTSHLLQGSGKSCAPYTRPGCD